MINSDILQPLVVLMAWTMVMWVWMYATRIPAMSRNPEIDVKAKRGGTGKDLDGLLPDRIQWKAHNYNHLHEAPTLFYAVGLMLAMIGQGDGMNALLAWIYAGLRIAHSIVQVTSNRVLARFVLFALSSVVLMALIFHAGIAVFAAH